MERKYEYQAGDCKKAFLAGVDFGFLNALDDLILSKDYRDRGFEVYLMDEASAKRKSAYPH